MRQNSKNPSVSSTLASTKIRQYLQMQRGLLILLLSFGVRLGGARFAGSLSQGAVTAKLLIVTLARCELQIEHNMVSNKSGVDGNKDRECHNNFKCRAHTMELELV